MFQMRWTEDDLKRVLNYLEKKASIFEEVRKKFNIGDGLGLASLPEFHDYRDGLLTKLKLREFLKLPGSRMIVKPLGSIYVYLISIYFSPGILENEKGITLDEGYFQAPDEVITGLFSHECAEYLCRHESKLIRPEFQRVLEKEIYLERFPRRFRFHLLNQCRADLLASLLGYKAEMLAMLEFLKDKYLKFENFHPDPLEKWPYRPPMELAAELKVRIDFIKGVC